MRVDMISKGVLVFDHDCHAHGDHVDVDLLIAQHVHLEVVVGLGLSELGLINLIQFFKED